LRGGLVGRIEFSSNNADFSKNTILNGSGSGYYDQLRIHGDGDNNYLNQTVYFSKNLFSGHSSGYYVEHSTSGSGQTYVSTTLNNMINNDEFYIRAGSVNSSVENNYWGTTTESEIQAMVYDWNDDASLGFLDYDPYLTAPSTLAPVSPPKNVVKQSTNGGVLLSWDANPEADVTGYKVYYGAYSGYSFASSVDAGNVTSYTLSGASISDTIAVTAYDPSANGTDDQTDGFESWFSFSGDPSPSMTLSSSSLDFGAVQNGQSSSLNITVGNDGTADLVVTDISSSNGYYIVSPTSFTVATGESQTVAVTFTPYENSILSGTITISNNSNSSNTFTVTGVGTSEGGTAVSGVISSNTTWTLANSPYIVTDDILLNEGITLTIEPGVTIKMLSDKEFQVKGELIAQGTSDSRLDR
jgi:hypothetical protein